MKKINILPQPTDVSCGPTCLQAVYDYYNDTISLDKVIKEVRQLKGGGTLAVMLGNHALKRGYQVTIYTYNLQVFDITWFENGDNLKVKLQEQLVFKQSRKLSQATNAYQRFLNNGGQIKFHELEPGLIQEFLGRGIPILTGLSATYLYRSPREIPEYNVYHDVKGEPVGHFVVLTEYSAQNAEISLADPLNPNPIKDHIQYYSVDIQRVINSILLGIVTYDANLLIIEKN